MSESSSYGKSKQLAAEEIKPGVVALRCDCGKTTYFGTLAASEHAEAKAVRLFGAHLEDIGNEKCETCDYSLNEIRDYVHELLSLREVAAAARAVVEGRVPAFSAELEGSEWKHSRIADSLTDRLRTTLTEAAKARDISKHKGKIASDETPYACVACSDPLIASGMCTRCGHAWGMGIQETRTRMEEAAHSHDELAAKHPQGQDRIKAQTLRTFAEVFLPVTSVRGPMRRIR